MHFDEAFDFLIERLAALPDLKGPAGGVARIQTFGCDVWVPNLVSAYWQPRITNFTYGDLQDDHFQPFYDATWELCRIGVLRPGSFAPRGTDMGNGSRLGDGFTVTAFGRTWLSDAAKRPITDPSRLSGVLQAFASRFGGGYAQRATEAVATYRNANYLAACVMAGAAAESILLALAIEKAGGNEAKVLAEYKTGGGRRKVAKGVVGNVATAIAVQFETALQVLHYWRDDAGHGTMTAISEIEAYASLSQLLRLAQFASDHWAVLTQ